MKELEKRQRRFPHQLTNHAKSIEELEEAIRQIEAVEGEGKGYDVREVLEGWAVFTKGDLITAETYLSPYKEGKKGVYSLGQYRDTLKMVKNEG